MILTCPKCSTRLKLETTALPTGTFNVSCPKCQNLISVSPPFSPVERTGPLSPPTGPSAPATTTAAATAPAAVSAAGETVAPDKLEQDPIRTLVTMLTAALSKPTTMPSAFKINPGQEEQTRRRTVMVCLSGAEDSAQVQAMLGHHDYDLLFIESAEYAIELLQISNKVDIVLLSPEFQVDNQGSTAILRFLSSLGPERRRRLFVVLTSPNCRTADIRAAFIQGVNLLVNSHEFQMLPLALSKGIQDFNYLYRAFHEASGATPF